MSPVEQQQESIRFNFRFGAWFLTAIAMFVSASWWLYDTRAEASLARSEAREIKIYTDRELCRISDALKEHITRDNREREKVIEAINALLTLTAKLDERTSLRRP